MTEEQIKEMYLGIINNGEKWERRCSKQECCSDCNYSCVENKIWQPYKLGEGIHNDWEYRKVETWCVFQWYKSGNYHLESTENLNDNYDYTIVFEGTKEDCEKWIEEHTVEEEPKYRPYKDTEEMINDFCERSGAKRSKMGEPFIWVKDGDCKLLILSIEKDCVWTVNCRWGMEELLDSFTYCDGSPIGKKE